MYMNSCNFVGRLADDPMLKKTASGISVCSFCLAVKRPFSKDDTDFINVVAWRHTAEYIAQYGKKGNLLSVTGSLQGRKWEDQSGNKRTTFEIISERVDLLSGRNDTHNSEQTEDTEQSDSDLEFEISEDEELPF